MRALVDGDRARRGGAERQGDERVEVHARARGLAEQGLQERALILLPLQVLVGERMTVPDESQRLRAAEVLAARGKVDAGVVVVQRGRKAHPHPAHLVHHAVQPAEPDPHVMVDPQPGDLLHGLDEQRRPAESEGRVDLVRAVTGDGHVGVARDADQHRLATAGVQQHEGVRVRGPHVAPDVQEVLLRPGEALPGVRTGDKPVLPRGLARIGRKRDRPVQLGVQIEVGGDHGEDQNHHDRASDQGDSPSVVARLAPESPPAAGSQSRLHSPARCSPARCGAAWCGAAWCWPAGGMVHLRLLGPCGAPAACWGGRYLA